MLKLITYLILIKHNLIKPKTLNLTSNTILRKKESSLCTAAALTTRPSNERIVCGFNMAKQWSSLVVHLPKHESPLEILGKATNQVEKKLRKPSQEGKVAESSNRVPRLFLLGFCTALFVDFFT